MKPEAASGHAHAMIGLELQGEDIRNLRKEMDDINPNLL